MGNLNLELTPRKENIRDKNQIIQFDLDDILHHFDENISNIKNQLTLADELVKSNNTSAAEEIWRSQIVFLESAFDFYMHELTKCGLLKIFRGEWNQTKKYRNLQLKMSYLERALDDNDDIWFLEFINEFYRDITMASFDSVKKQFSLLGIDRQQVADNAFYYRNSSEKTIDKLQRRLDDLFKRRNCIAHQSDRRHENAMREGISKEDAVNFIADIEKVVYGIDKHIRTK